MFVIGVFRGAGMAAGADERQSGEYGLSVEASQRTKQEVRGRLWE